MRKLTSDDAFRHRFEKSPPTALLEIGVPAETISTLSEKCIPTRALASNDMLRKTLEELESGIATECLTMLIPNAKLQVSK